MIEFGYSGRKPDDIILDLLSLPPKTSIDMGNSGTFVEGPLKQEFEHCLRNIILCDIFDDFDDEEHESYVHPELSTVTVKAIEIETDLGLCRLASIFHRITSGDSIAVQEVARGVSISKVMSLSENWGFFTNDCYSLTSETSSSGMTHLANDIIVSRKTSKTSLYEDPFIVRYFLLEQN